MRGVAGRVASAWRYPFSAVSAASGVFSAAPVEANSVVNSSTSPPMRTAAANTRWIRFFSVGSILICQGSIREWRKAGVEEFVICFWLLSSASSSASGPSHQNLRAQFTIGSELFRRKRVAERSESPRGTPHVDVIERIHDFHVICENGHA